MAEHPNVEVTRKALEAFMKGDVQTLASMIAEDAVWHIPGKNRFSGGFRGRDAIMARFQQIAEAGLKVSMEEIHDIVGNDEHVVALVTLGAEGPDGSARSRSVQVYHVSGGQATEFWGYNENQEGIDALFGS